MMDVFVFQMVDGIALTDMRTAAASACAMKVRLYTVPVGWKVVYVQVPWKTIATVSITFQLYFMYGM